MRANCRVCRDGFPERYQSPVGLDVGVYLSISLAVMLSFGIGLPLSSASAQDVSRNPMAVESRPFAGITEIVAKPSLGRLQRLSVAADLPFEYECQRVDTDHVLVILHRAHLADALVNPQGVVKIQSNGHIDSAFLARSDNPDNVRLVLSGKALGNKQILMEGGIQITAAPSEDLTTHAVSQETTQNQDEATPVATSTDISPLVRQPAVVQAAQRIELAPEPEASEPVPVRNQKIAVANEPLPNVTQKVKSDDAYLMLDYEQPKVDGVQPYKIRNKWEPLRVTTSNFAQPNNAPSQVEMPSASTQEPVNVLMTDEKPSKKKVPLNSIPQSSLQQAEPLPADRTAQPGDTIGHAGVRSDEVYKGPTITALPAYPYAPPSPRIQTTEPPMRYQMGPSTPSQDTAVNVLSFADVSGHRVNELMQQALSEYKLNDFVAAEAKIRQAIAQNEDDANLFAALGEIQVKTNRLREAEQSYAQANTLDSQYSLRYAEVLVLNHQRPQAILVLENMLSASMQSLESNRRSKMHYMLGTLYEETGDTNKALTQLQLAAQFSPDNADIHYNLGVAYELSGNITQAKQHYAKASQLNPTAQDAKLALRRIQS